MHYLAHPSKSSETNGYLHFPSWDAWILTSSTRRLNSCTGNYKYLCGWVRAYLFVHVYLSGKLSFSLANWITLLRAKSLATEIKQLCFVVMVHEILFKTRLPSRNEGTKENRRSALGVQYLKQTASPPSLITINQDLLEKNMTCSFQTSLAHSTRQKL